MIDPAQLEFAAPAAPVWRIGRRPRPWDWVDWAFAAEESGTFTGRWDSPVPHSYRTIYAGTEPQGALRCNGGLVLESQWAQTSWIRLIVSRLSAGGTMSPPRSCVSAR